MADAEENVKGGKEIQALAEKGLALFAAKEEDKVELDTAGAQKFKDEEDAKFTALEAESAALTGKDNAKARKEKSKQASDIKKTDKYIDAVNVIKGKTPKNGNFAKIEKAAEKVEEVVAAEADEDKKDKKEKPKKAIESAGISKAERDELEKLKNDIIARKKELKETGMSGGQINKDEEIATWVKRMNDLKEKENPGALAAQKEEKKGGSKKKMSAEQEQDKKKLEQDIEEYRAKLKSEFGYTNKDIKADPDLNEMCQKLAAMK